jgi:hypothetical protein
VVPVAIIWIRKFAIGALALAGVTRTSGAWADAERFRIVYRAGSGCPDERTFVDRVASRLEGTRLASNADADARSISVELTARETDSSGRLEFTDANGETVVRTVAGRTCDETASGLALIAALAIEALSAPPAPAQLPPTEPRIPSPPSADAPPAGAPSADAHAPVGFGAGVTGGVDASSAPSAGLAFGIYGELAWRAPLRFARIVARRVESEASVNERKATFTKWSARVEACPVSVAIAPRLELPACAALELGRLSGEGQPSASLPDASSAAILWAAAGASSGLRWEIGRSWVVSARGSAEFPLTRHKFVFKGPSEPIFEIPPVGWGAAIELGAHFP